MNYGKKQLAKDQEHRKRKSARRKKRGALLIIRSLLVFLLVIIAGAALGVTLYVKSLIKDLPDVSTINISPTGYSTTVLDNQGREIEKLAASGANRVYVHLNEIPVNVQNAFIAIEDERFWKHKGIDIRGIFRAAYTGLTSGGRLQGASTITQQLLKNNYFTSWTKESSLEESLKRKIQEQYLAIQLEKVTDKQTILENYLNTINLGQNTLGVQAASQRYFNKDVKDLTLSEAAVIAGITQNPSKYNPITHPDKNAQRREKVLSNMLRQGLISEAEYQEAESDDVYSRIAVANSSSSQDSLTTYYMDALTDEVVKDLVEQKGYTDTQALQMLYAGGLTIKSTQDMTTQAIVDEEVNRPENYPGEPKVSFSYRLTVRKKDNTTKNYSEQTMLTYYRKKSGKNYSINFSSQEKAQAAIDQYKTEILEEGDTIPVGGESTIFTLQPQVAMTVIDQKTGKVLALTGGRGDKVASKTLNRATSITRQPGSTFKILSTYAPALDAADMSLAHVEDDSPFSYSTGGKQVKNSDGSYRGFTTFREGIEHSINIVALKALGEIGTGLGYEYVQDFGISTLVSGDNNQALAIGGITNGVTNLELTNAFATIADEGKYHKPIFYTQVLDHDGNVILDNEEEMEAPRTVLKKTTAWLLTNAMEGVMNGGTGTRANPGNMTVAGKTGTTNDNRDTLMMGFTPHYTVGIWGGYDDNSKQGSTIYSKNIWRNVMKRLNEGLDDPGFPKPKGIVQVSVCKKSGKLPVPGVCDADPRGNMVYTEYFAKGTEPTESCDHHVKLRICTASNMPAATFCPPDLVQDRVFITGNAGGTADGPYAITEAQKNAVCNIHTSLAPGTTPSGPEDPGDETDPDKKTDKKKPETGTTKGGSDEKETGTKKEEIP